MRRILSLLLSLVLVSCTAGCANLPNKPTELAITPTEEQIPAENNALFTDEFFIDVVEICDLGSLGCGVVSGDKMEPVIRYLQGLTLRSTDKHLRTTDEDGNPLYGPGALTFRKSDGTEIHVIRNHTTLTFSDKFSYVAEGVNLNADLKEAFGNQYS